MRSVNTLYFANVNPGNKGFATYNLIYSATITNNAAVGIAFRLGYKEYT